MKTLFCLSLCLLLMQPALAGTTYQVSSTDGDQSVTYEVNFGGGRMFEQYTAYDPATKQFVYLSFKRGEQAPKPASVIWDHNTGKNIELFTFPGAEHPLPVIPSIKSMKYCPKTGDKAFSAKPIIAYD